MPYDSAAQLPASVKKRVKSARKRRQFVHVFNSVYKRTGDEGRAFASANSVVGRKEVTVAKSLTVVRGEKSVKVTLYSGADDPQLPDHVKTLPSNLRARWVNNYNWCVQDCQDDATAMDMADEQTTLSVDDLMGMMISGSKEAPAPEVPVAPVSAAPVVAGEGVSRPSGNSGGRATPSIMAKIKEWLGGKSAPEWENGPSMPEPSNLEVFALKEAPDGSMHAILVYSNVFKDKGGEIFSEAAHKEYEAALDAGMAPYPELHLWHGGPETRWGQVEQMVFIDGFAVAGAVVEPGKEHVALKVKELSDQGEIAVSHGYVGLLGPDKVHRLYRSFELSPLPVGSEANPWTATALATSGISGNKENEGDMAWNDKKKGWFKQHFGMDDAAIASAEKKFGEMAAALKASGVDWKEDAEAEQTPAPTPAPQPTPPDPAPVPPPPAPAAPVVAGVAEATPAGNPIEVLTGAITALTERVTGLATEVVALKEQQVKDAGNIEARAQDTVLARIAGAMNGNGGHSPATAAGTVVPGLKEDKSPTAWLDDIIVGVVGAPTIAAPSGASIAHVNNGEVK